MNGLNYGLQIIPFLNVANVTRYEMTSEELADQVTKCVESLRSRIMGTGDQQYSRGNEQSIEIKSGEQIVKETVEELDDAIVYLAHLRARLNRLAQL
jgi:hypothetical protein